MRNPLAEADLRRYLENPENIKIVIEILEEQGWTIH